MIPLNTMSRICSKVMDLEGNYHAQDWLVWHILYPADYLPKEISSGRIFWCWHGIQDEIWLLWSMMLQLVNEIWIQIYFYWNNFACITLHWLSFLLQVRNLKSLILCNLICSENNISNFEVPGTMVFRGYMRNCCVQRT